MKLVLVLSFVGAFLLAFPGAYLVWSKAHVPFDMVQVCNRNGEVKNIKAKKLEKELDKGGCRLPACDFDNVFLAGNACDNTDAAGGADGFCDIPGSPPAIPSDSAIGVTLACTNPY